MLKQSTGNPCHHGRVFSSACGQHCADCGDMLTLTEHAISDCSHPIGLIMPPPYPDSFPCPQCGQWVQVEATLAGG